MTVVENVAHTRISWTIQPTIVAIPTAVVAHIYLMYIAIFRGLV